MKQLKFMIAATAAIGLAGVAQAAFPSTTELDAAGNTGFEEYADGAAVTTGTLGKKFENGEKTNTDEAESFFWYTGDVAADNESKIKAGSSGLPAKAPRAKGDKFNADDNVLEVNTGTDPLLRTINRVVTNEGVSSAEPVTVPAETGIYIDTLVQFTVTPAGDTVTPKAGDKLMIYLQEVLDNTETTDVDEAATNLVVVAGRSDDGQALVRETYTVNNVAVEPNKWYRLRVKAFDSVYTDSSAVLPAFTIEVDGTVCTFDKPSCGQTALAMILGAGKAEIQTILAGGQSLVFSLIAEKTLKAVGFAGEGKVDDIVFSTTLDPIVDAIDFTFVLGEGVTSVSWTVGGNTYTATATDTTPVTSKVSKTDEVEITNVDYADWYVASGTYVKDWTGTGITANLTVAATKVGSSESTVDDFVKDATSAETAATVLGVENTAFTTAGAATADDAKAVLTKGLNWAKKLGKAPSYLNDINFANPNDAKANAYLLNCDPKDVEAIDDQFKFEAFSFEIVDGKPVVDIDGVATSWKVGEDAAVPFNGTPVIKGAATPNGTYGAIDANSKFFKAFLVK